MIAYRHGLFAILFALWSTVAAAAPQHVRALYDALYLDVLVDVIVAEGQDQIRETADMYLSERSSDPFITQAGAFYAPDTIKAKLIAGLDDGMTDAQVDLALAFFTSDLGCLAAELEASARVAISDPAVEDDAMAAAARARRDADPRIAQLQSFMTDMDLVDLNLAGAMTAQYHFLMPLIEVDRLGLSQAEIFALIEESRREVTTSIQEWLIAFLYMAYRPLSDDQLAMYLQYQTSQNGHALNQALFDMFNAIDRDASAFMGTALAQALQSQEL